MKPVYFRIYICSLFLGVSMLSPCLYAGVSSDPQTIVEKVIEAYGGRAALERIKVIKESGTVRSLRLAKTGRLERVLELPAKLKVDINYPGGPHEQRLTTPEGAWRSGRPAPAPMHAAMMLQAARFQLPLILTKHAVTLVVEDSKQVTLALKLSNTTGLEVQIDKKTWHIAQSIGRMQMGSVALEFIADYSDFKKVEGVLFAHREELQAMGQATGVAVIDKIEINSPVKADYFRPQK